MTVKTDMTKLMFDLAKMAGKESKMGVLNPLMRQGLGVGTFFDLASMVYKANADTAKR